MHIEHLTIELTRRCNLSCDHCLRGTAQNCNIDKKYIDAILKRFSSIGILCLGGGESSLVPELIIYIIKQLKKNKISVRSFDITTNAVKVPNAFINAIMKLYLYCEDKETCSLSLSNDGYHLDSVNKDLENNYQKLEVFRFTSRRKINNGDYYHDSIIDQGKGRLYGGMALTLSKIYINNSYEDYIDTEFYVNCFGNVVNSCDLSYESQDCEALHIFNVLDDVDIFKKIEEYNERIGYIIEENHSDNVECIVDYYECYINVEKPEEKAA